MDDERRNKSQLITDYIEVKHTIKQLSEKYDVSSKIVLETLTWCVMSWKYPKTNRLSFRWIWHTGDGISVWWSSRTQSAGRFSNASMSGKRPLRTIWRVSDGCRITTLRFTAFWQTVVVDWKSPETLFRPDVQVPSERLKNSTGSTGMYWMSASATVESNAEHHLICSRSYGAPIWVSGVT